MKCILICFLTVVHAVTSTTLPGMLTSPHIVMNDGSHFHELRRLTPEEHDVQRGHLQSFLEHPDLHIPQMINHAERFSSHYSEVFDDYGRKCIINYTLEHSEHHIFRNFDVPDILNISESVDGNTLTLFFSTEESAAEYYANYSAVVEGENLLMVTGSAKWGLRRSFKGITGEVYMIQCALSCLLHCTARPCYISNIM
jgi:hypothetical protein